MAGTRGPGKGHRPFNGGRILDEDDYARGGPKKHPIDEIISTADRRRAEVNGTQRPRYYWEDEPKRSSSSSSSATLPGHVPNTMSARERKARATAAKKKGGTSQKGRAKRR